MTPDRWSRVKAVFGAAVEAPAYERPQLLADACSDDAELRREVESLLAADSRASGRFEAPAAALLESFEGETGLGMPERLGPYRLLREIGRGGMGTIFLAERDDDEYRKRVAIKLINRGLVSDDNLRRFRYERQILADLDHPNIARLLDGGTAPDGHPYIVMEHVEGVPIDVSCNERGLDVKARVALFRQVCAAVQYAHQQLVIHRDLKPGNVLVTKEGVPKLLDFGIARLFSAPGGMAADQTVTEHRAMTPQYASPEQVLGRPIGTASDVYSLGVILFELLTGEPPYRVEGRLPHEVSRAICETEPERPSAAVRRATNSSRTGAESRRAARVLKGDLDNIVLMALRKDPERRYATAERLDDDLRRFLEGLPVRARADTPGYRATKFIRRNPLGVAAAVLLFLSVAGGILGTLREARIADRRLRDTRRLANSIIFELHDSIQGITGATKARELLVKRALEYLDSLAREAGNDPTLLRELATAYEKIGDAQGRPGIANLGQFDAAIKSYDQSLRIRQELLTDHRDDEGVARELASSYIRLGHVLSDRGHLRDATASFQEATALLEPLYARKPLDSVGARDLGVTYMLTGDAVGSVDRPNLGDAAKALGLYRRGFAIQQKLLGADPKSGEKRHFMAAHTARVALAEAHLGLGGEATRDLESALLLLDDLGREYPRVGSIRRDKAALEVAKAEMLAGEDPARATSLLAAAEATFSELAAADAANADATEDLAWVSQKEGELYRRTDPARARRALEKAISLRAPLLEMNPGRARLVYQAARAHADLAVLVLSEPERSRQEDQAALVLLEASQRKGNMDRRVVALAFEIRERLAAAR